MNALDIPMDKTYDPHAIEQKWYQTWEQNGYFSADAETWKQGRRDSYCIMIPPPNVTGRLHMGHAFQDTIMDALIRYHRMKGDNTLWQAGTDHAGIATQMVVERLLNAALPVTEYPRRLNWISRRPVSCVWSLGRMNRRSLPGLSSL